MTTKIGVCNLCEAICGLQITIKGTEVTGIRGNPDDPLSRGHVCPKGVALADVYADPDRLRSPVKKVNGEFVETSWEDAFNIVADSLARIAKAHGRDAIAFYLGNPNAHSLGALTHGPQLLKAVGSKNVYSATSVDQLPQQLIATLMFGHQFLVPIPDIDRTQYFLIFGGNPMASNGSLMTVPDFPQRARDLRARGAKMVVFDPRRTETAAIADEHVPVRPGTDAYLLLAMLHVVFADDLVSAPTWIDDLSPVADLVATFTPERAEQVSGVSAATIRRITHEYAAAEGAAAYGRLGVSVQEFGLVCHWAIHVLNIVTGNLDREGGVMLTKPAIDVVGRGVVGRGGHGRYVSRVRGLPESGRELPVATLTDEIVTPGEGQIKALVTVAGNPVLSTPGGQHLEQALDHLDFQVAIDIYVNETTRHAEVILPPTTALERDHYDLIFHVLAVRNTARFTPAVFPKPVNARHDWEISRELILRLERRLGIKRSLKDRLRISLSPTRMVAGLLRAHGSGVTLAKLRKRPSGIDLGPMTPQLPGRLQTKDKRVRLLPDLIASDVRRLDQLPHASADGLLLIGRRHKQDCNSWMHNSPRLTKGRPRHQLLMHPEDLSARGLRDGQLVRVSSRVGSVSVEVQSSSDMMPGVVSLPHGYGHANTGQTHAAQVAGVSINDLTDPELLDVSGNAALNGVPVEVEAA